MDCAFDIPFSFVEHSQIIVSLIIDEPGKIAYDLSCNKRDRWRKIRYHYRMIAPEPITVSATVLLQMFLYLDSLKVDIDAFLRSLHIEPETVRSPDAYLPIETYLHIQDGAAEYVNDPYFGLHMGEFAQPGSWSILGYLMMNCKTLGEAFPLNPLEVTFIYPEPKSRAEYERIFNCPVHFAKKDNSMTLDMRMGSLPVRMANPALLEHFEKYAQDFLAQMERNDATTKTVTKIILARLDDESLSIEKVACEMSVSVRTLQKRLEVEGVVFSDLLRDIRQRLARKYLHENYSVEQITYLLGFSEPSVFRKAFKKWMGVTPREYRQGMYTAASQM
jgi:AraC-like DNA-binding protein